MRANVVYFFLFYLLFFLGRYVCEFITIKTWVYFTGFIFGWIILTVTILVNRSKIRSFLDSVDKALDGRSCPRKKES